MVKLLIFSFLFCITSGFCRDVSLQFKDVFFNEDAAQVEDVDGIVGGDETSIEEHPHQVSFWFEQRGQMFFCGGFIVSENYILTAGHCTDTVQANSIILRAGSSFHDDGGSIIPIAEVITHPSYNDLQFNNDVGILKTAAPIQFSNVMKAIKLPKKGRQMKAETNVVVSGWGRTQEAGTLSNHLMAVQIPVVDHAECEKNYQPVVTVTKNMFCAGLGGKASCKGDSGGAIQQDGMAVGIVSWAGGCARPQEPSVFTDIASPSIRDFITQHTGL